MRPTLVLALAALLAACAPPEVGPSIPGGGIVPLEPTLASISARIFTPRCATCHSGGGSAPVDLTAEAARASLVDAPSTEVEMLLVAPGDPERSYLLVRLLPTDVRPMPPDEPLSDAERQAVSDWIFNGAPND